MIQIEHLTKAFPNQTAIQNLTASLPKGQIIGLVGPDGSGKTTLIRLLAGLLLPTKGKITVAGYNTATQAESIHEILGYMPQRFGLYEDLTVEQNLILYADLNGVVGEERKQIFEKLLRFTGLKPFTQRLARNLSGGMKQKLGLACTLIRKPVLLLLDEPSVGVDPVSRRELWKMVRNLTDEEITIVWSTTYLDEAEKCPHILLLNEGKLLYEGPPEMLVHGSSFEDAFVEILGGDTPRPFRPRKKNKEIVIQVDHLTKQFGDFTAVNEVSFQIHKGEIFGLLGPNGAGKSTIFKMLCGLLKPSSGTLKMGNVTREKIGYMAQKFSLYGDLSVLQNLQFFAGIYHSIETEAIELFHLQPYLSMTTKDLPLGYKQRLALACATMHHPEILFLDEPTSGVDPITRREFWHHIHYLAEKGTTVVVTTHFMEEAEYADYLGLIFEGKMLTIGTPEELKGKVEEKENPTMEDAFVYLIEHAYDS